jgi:hypothetical protein
MARDENNKRRYDDDDEGRFGEGDLLHHEEDVCG